MRIHRTHRIRRTHLGLLGILSTVGVTLAGCAYPGVRSPNTPGSASSANVVQVTGAAYNPRTQTTTIQVSTDNPASPGNRWGARAGGATAGTAYTTGEHALDLTDQSGIINYATTHFAGKPLQWIRVVPVHAATTRHQSPTMIRVPDGLGQAGAGIGGANASRIPGQGANTNAAAGYVGGGTGLPPGVQMDPSIRPLAGLNAPRAVKFNAVLRVARSKLGTPYIWGHNEDRGQYGFDCSNFTAYVYHHALGYRISSMSRVQYTSVGYRVSRSNLQPGDLVVFRLGAHVGIYVGNQQMIDEGGGLGKVSYMTIAPGSYWGNHISAIKRMF